jgi:hypothetical protein
MTGEHTIRLVLLTTGTICIALGLLLKGVSVLYNLNWRRSRAASATNQDPSGGGEE